MRYCDYLKLLLFSQQTVLEDSDKKPILRLAALVPGKYTFTLKVVDQKGLYGEEKATVTVLKGKSIDEIRNNDVFHGN